MGWEKARVRDGDPIYHVSEWRKELERRKVREKRSLEERVQEKQVLKEEEVMMKHPVTGALLRFTDDGSIEMMAAGAGIRLSPSGIDLLGERIVVSSGDIHVLNEKRGLEDGTNPVRRNRLSTDKEIKQWRGVNMDVD